MRGQIWAKSYQVLSECPINDFVTAFYKILKGCTLKQLNYGTEIIWFQCTCTTYSKNEYGINVFLTQKTIVFNN